MNSAKGLTEAAFIVNLKEKKLIYKQGPRSKFSSGGAKEECVKEIFFFHIFSDVAIGSENSPSLN